MRRKLNIGLLLGLTATKWSDGVADFFAMATANGHEVTMLDEDLSFYARADFHAIITPGNSYGHMTGGLDQAVVDLVGDWVEPLVRDTIQNDYCGELNVGSAFIATNLKSKFPHVVYAPTMRSPTHLPRGSDVPYTAMLAALQAIHRWNDRNPDQPITNILMPLFGVGTGMIPIPTALRQQARALARYSNDKPIEHLFKDGKNTDQHLTETWPRRF
ncbi:tail protein [Pseudomonas phage Noxifer]|uniref:Putative tail protein n=1 Tax=Pseudomonas phage Noxifer TaxID=2006684 RepID=A0A1Y0T0H7_9CAUD|nr:tail protein [Pseudomonas phage Noxifer]ARV77446.1 putative tail protein [Pseudomonas phage Noxifer]